MAQKCPTCLWLGNEFDLVTMWLRETNEEFYPNTTVSLLGYKTIQVYVIFSLQLFVLARARLHLVYQPPASSHITGLDCTLAAATS
jgi:hypothetical protein